MARKMARRAIRQAGYRVHSSSFENMELVYRRYVLGRDFGPRGGLDVLDVGGADVNGSYKPIFEGTGARYIVADLETHPSVDIILEDPYKLPFPDDAFDIVISGQMLEHCEFFWVAFSEMVRVCKPTGFIFLIAPSAGPIHRYPVDCYRFYPDSYRALAKWTGCHLIDCWLDERGPWRDLMGVFSPTAQEAITDEPQVAVVLPWSGVSPDPAEELAQGTLPYLQVLATIHAAFQPTAYLEIGVRHGHSLALAKCPAIGIDPSPDLTISLPASTQIEVMSSDAFFRSEDRRRAASAADLIFIDGLHHFEYVLRDFMNVERIAPQGALIIIDDVLPNHPAQADRTRRTQVWTGDVWKMEACLNRWRPDLFTCRLDTSPSGMLLVGGIDPTNFILWQNYNSIVRAASEIEDFPEALSDRSGTLCPTSPAFSALLTAWRAARDAGENPATLLRTALADGTAVSLTGNDQHV